MYSELIKTHIRCGFATDYDPTGSFLVVKRPL